MNYGKWGDLVKLGKFKIMLPTDDDVDVAINYYNEYQVYIVNC